MLSLAFYKSRKLSDFAFRVLFLLFDFFKTQFNEQKFNYQFLLSFTLEQILILKVASAGNQVKHWRLNLL